MPDALNQSPNQSTNQSLGQQLDQQLTLMQLADSFFPSGSYTLSHGLESLVQAKAITTAKQLECFVQMLVCNKVGTTDLVALTHAHRASQQNDIAGIAEVDARLFAQTPIAKTRTTQRQGGRALLMVASKTWPHPQLAMLEEMTTKQQFHCLHPIVFAVVAQAANLNETATQLAFMHSFVTGVLGAGIRLGIVGHLQAQQVRRAVNKDIADVCTTATNGSLDEMYSCTPLIDIAQMRQAKLSRRLFAS